MLSRRSLLKSLMAMPFARVALPEKLIEPPPFEVSTTSIRIALNAKVTGDPTCSDLAQLIIQEFSAKMQEHVDQVILHGDGTLRS